MAKLEIRTPEPVRPPEEYVLTLSKEEAMTLRALVGVTTGSDLNSPRKYINALWKALEKVPRDYGMLLEGTPKFEDFRKAGSNGKD